jgi:hypothetical protein
MHIPRSFMYQHGHEKVEAAYLSIANLYGRFTDKADKEIMFQLDMPKSTWSRMKKLLAVQGYAKWKADGVHILPLKMEPNMLIIGKAAICYQELKAVKVQYFTYKKRLKHLSDIIDEHNLDIYTDEDLFRTKLWFMRKLSVAHKWDGDTGTIRYQFTGNLFLKDIMHVFGLNNIKAASKLLSSNPFIKVITEGKNRAQKLEFNTAWRCENIGLKFYERCANDLRRIERAFFRKVKYNDSENGGLRIPTLSEFRQWFYNEFKLSKWQLTERMGIWCDADGNIVARIHYKHYYRKLPLVDLIDRSNDKYVDIINYFGMEKAMQKGTLTENLHDIYGRLVMPTPIQQKPVTLSQFNGCLHYAVHKQ